MEGTGRGEKARAVRSLHLMGQRAVCEEHATCRSSWAGRGLPCAMELAARLCLGLLQRAKRRGSPCVAFRQVAFRVSPFARKCASTCRGASPVEQVGLACQPSRGAGARPYVEKQRGGLGYVEASAKQARDRHGTGARRRDAVGATRRRMHISPMISAHAHLGTAGRETLWGSRAASGPGELRDSERTYASTHAYHATAGRGTRKGTVGCERAGGAA
jgi:hypothetical protein